MAVLGFHFSGIYKEALFSGKKTATIMLGENPFQIGQEVQMYLSDKPNLFEGKVETRIGKATIEKVVFLKIDELTQEQSQLCSYNTTDELKADMVKWYGALDNPVITFIKFKLELYWDYPDIFNHKRETFKRKESLLKYYAKYTKRRPDTI